MSHLSRILAALGHDSNNQPAIDEPINDFEVAVNNYHDHAVLLAQLKALIKPLEADERELRNGIAESLIAFYGDNLNEGVNNYPLSNKRTLKFTHKVERKIEAAMIPVARAAFEKADDAVGTFDDLLRIKYELAAAPFKKIPPGGTAALAVSRMITAKPAAPTIVID